MQTILKTLKSAFPLTLLTLFLILAACATDPGTGGGGGPTGGGTPSGGGSGEVAVKKANIDVGGTKKDVLTTVDGLTLYYFDPDTGAADSACKDACAKAWPPYLFKGTGSPAADGADSAKLKVVTTVHGAQLSYNGHLLYTYSGDGKAGDANGDGAGGGKWHVSIP
jgi:predicted lipoprotein with Yx(FWY)xxD motif